MSLSQQPFERHPALASWIERLANSQTGLSLGEWMIFLGSLNHALDAARQEGAGDWRPIAEYDGFQPVLVGREPDKYLWGPYAAFKDVTGVWRIHGGAGCVPLHFEPTLFKPLPPPPSSQEGGE